MSAAMLARCLDTPCIPVEIVFITLPNGIVSCYDPAGPRILISPTHWHQLDRAHRRAIIAHEVGHHLTASAYHWRAPQSTRVYHEGRAKRAGLRWLIPDSAVYAALRAGCRSVRDFAEYWDLPEAETAYRLRDYRAGAQPCVF